MASTFDKIYKRTKREDEKNRTYTVAAKIGKENVPLKVFSGATSTEDGDLGLVPPASSNDIYKFLRGDGTWSAPPNTEYNPASPDNPAGGLMTPEDKAKLDGIEPYANNYTLPTASTATTGGIKLDGDGRKVLYGDGQWLNLPENIDTHWQSNLSFYNDMADVDGTGIYQSVVKICFMENGEKKGEYPIHASGVTRIYEENGIIYIESNPPEMVGAKWNRDGTAGYVPKPETSNQYQFLRGDGSWATPQDTTYSTVTTDEDGLMSSWDKEKLDRIEDEANNYILPQATSEVLGGIMLDEETDSSHFLNGLGNWATPQDTTYALATSAFDGLMSHEDKEKISTVEMGANKYVLPQATSLALGGIKLHSDNSLFLDGTGNWSTPTDTTYANATTDSNGLMPKESLIKLNGIAENANNYVLPAASSEGLGGIMLNNDSGKYLDGTGSWSIPQDTTYGIADESINGLMTPAMVSKLNGIEASANYYILPYASTATVGGIQFDGNSGLYLDGSGSWTIPQDTTYTTATSDANGLMSKIDKSKLDSINVGGDGSIYTLPEASVSSLGGIMLSGDASKFLNGSGNWSTPVNTTYANATTDAAGLLPRLNGSSSKFLDGLGGWSTPANTTYAEATSQSSGLISSNDKVKLDSIASNANNYTLPAATSSALGGIMLNNSVTQFLDGTGNWSTPANTTYVEATSSSNGLLSAADKTKLDTIAANANDYTLPAASSTALGGVQLSDNDSQYLNGRGNWSTPANTTYAEATTSVAGLMSTSDKTKLDTIVGIDETTYLASATQPGVDEQPIGALWFKLEDE